MRRPMPRYIYTLVCHWLPNLISGVSWAWLDPRPSSYIPRSHPRNKGSGYSTSLSTVRFAQLHVYNGWPVCQSHLWLCCGIKWLNYLGLCFGADVTRVTRGIKNWLWTSNCIPKLWISDRTGRAAPVRPARGTYGGYIIPPMLFDIPFCPDILPSWFCPNN